MTWPAIALAALLQLLPDRPYTALLVTFTGPVPHPAVRLFAALLGSGLVLVVTLGLLARHVAQARPRHLFWAFAALYGLLALWTSQIQSLTGDEPHYLLAARSLAADGDADLTNDYGLQLWRPFYPSDRLRRALGTEQPLDPHDVPGTHGERRPVHQLGLSALLAPAWLVGGRPGAMLVAVLLAALAAAVTVRLAEWGADDGWPGALCVIFLSPLAVYSSSLHSEPAAALCLAVLAWSALGGEQRPRWLPLAAAAGAAWLPWLHLKFLPVGGLLALWLAWTGWRAGDRRWLWPLAALAAGLATQLAAYQVMYGSWSPNAPQLRGAGKFPGAFTGSLWHGLPGLLFDQQDGLFWVWPLGLLAGPGVVRLSRRPGARCLLAATAVHLLLIATYALWRSGYAPAGRQLLPLLPLLAPFVAAGWEWNAAHWPRPLRIVVALNAAIVLLDAWLPRLRYPFEALDGLPRSPILAKLHLPGLDLLVPVTSSGLAPLVMAWLYVGLWLMISARAAKENDG